MNEDEIIEEFLDKLDMLYTNSTTDGWFTDKEREQARQYIKTMINSVPNLEYLPSPILDDNKPCKEHDMGSGLE